MSLGESVSYQAVLHRRLVRVVGPVKTLFRLHSREKILFLHLLKFQFYMTDILRAGYLLIGRRRGPEWLLCLRLCSRSRVSVAAVVVCHLVLRLRRLA